MEITFLGTSSMVPTKKRNQSAVLVKYGSEYVLVDCGEGTQRQFTCAGVSLAKITKILITHWHGDHVLGLPGVIQTLNASNYEGILEIYGPKGTKKFIKHMFSAFAFTQKIRITVFEVDKEKVFETSDVIVRAKALKHSTPCLGYLIEEKGKYRVLEKKLEKLGVPKGPLWGKIQQGKAITHKKRKISAANVTKKIMGRKVVVFGDTSVCENALKLAKGVDVLICESTFGEENKDKAEEYNHLTSMQAATIAKKANARKLYLTHFSTRYKETDELVRQARKVFRNSYAASDLATIKVNKK